MCDTRQKPRVKLGDLGLAARLKNGKGIEKNAGTLAFNAPEGLLKQRADFKSDVWSLGVLLYTLICSHLPFKTKAYKLGKEEELAAREVTFTHAHLQSASPACNDILRGMLKSDPAERLSISEVI